MSRRAEQRAIGASRRRDIGPSGRGHVTRGFVVERLQRTFAGVAEPGLLRNQNGVPMYLLIFACANPQAVGPALRIANNTLKGLR